MKHTRTLISALSVWLALAGVAQAACYADYKARRDQPYGLHYGVVRIEVSPCEMSAEARSQVERKVSAGGWTVLQVQAVFGDDGLAGRRQDAGEYFLRF